MFVNDITRLENFLFFLLSSNMVSKNIKFNFFDVNVIDDVGWNVIKESF